MDEKLKNKLIIILSITTLIATGFAIYFGLPGTTTTGERALDTVAEQRRTIEQLQSNLSAATEAVQSATTRAEQLSERNERTQQLARESAEWIAGIRTTVAESGNTIQGLIASQRRINELIKRIEANNNAITE